MFEFVLQHFFFRSELKLFIKIKMNSMIWYKVENCVKRLLTNEIIYSTNVDKKHKQTSSADRAYLISKYRYWNSCNSHDLHFTQRPNILWVFFISHKNQTSSRQNYLCDTKRDKSLFHLCVESTLVCLLVVFFPSFSWFCGFYLLPLLVLRSWRCLCSTNAVVPISKMRFH